MDYLLHTSLSEMIFNETYVILSNDLMDRRLLINITLLAPPVSRLTSYICYNVFQCQKYIMDMAISIPFNII